MKPLNRQEIMDRVEELAKRLPTERTQSRTVTEYKKGKKVEKELTYIPIWVTIEELNSRFGTHWSTENLRMSTQDVSYSYNQEVLDENGKLQWIKNEYGKSYPLKERKFITETAVFISLDVVLRDKDGKEVCRRPGTGSGTNSGQRNLDADKMAKTALANALRKGSNNYGLGLYLWHGKDDTLPEPENDETSTASAEAGPVMTELNREKLKLLKEKHSLDGGSMGDHLKSCFPASGGQYSFLKVDDENGTQDQKVAKFVKFVNDHIARKE